MPEDDRIQVPSGGLTMEHLQRFSERLCGLSPTMEEAAEGFRQFGALLRKIEARDPTKTGKPEDA